MPAAVRKSAKKNKPSATRKTTTRKTSAKTKKAPAQKKAISKAAPKKLKPITEKQTSLQVITQIAEELDLSSNQVKSVFSKMHELTKRHLMPRGSGELPLPEQGLKLVRTEKPRTAARTGRNPATGEPVKIAAKPKHNVVKAKVMSKLKDIYEK